MCMPPIQGLALATSVGSGDLTILLDLEAYIDRQWRGWLARCGTSVRMYGAAGAMPSPIVRGGWGGRV
jgi:hypothetical protein